MTRSTSRAVLAGTWNYDDEFLANLPAAENSLQRMYDFLSHPQGGSWPDKRVTPILEERNFGNAAEKIQNALQDVTHTALFYYVGHGLLDDRKQLYLGLQGSKLGNVRTTSLEWEMVRHLIENCKARRKIVILDCCFAGAAATASSRVASRDDILHGNAVISLMASGTRSLAWYETNVTKPQTYFTRSLLDVLWSGSQGFGPELGFAFSLAADKMHAQGLPRPLVESYNMGTWIRLSADSFDESDTTRIP
ncbi:caspase domain-containing protein [Promicromonospora sp. AC04]|uniref:caspase, EACC1-associated type n=1 Tax=Promicromonospora sp. AC04 TaxID=2135723 RepID=UPI000D3434AA|nr:caspase family protein [Promicromonospora sp. AC04]PUB20887.1 caspase domain-containing protein [Promicromonospora sp. AC04]